MKKRKLSTGMVRVILTCWIIPYIVVSSVLIMLYNRNSQQQIGSTVITAMENAGLLTADRIYDAIEMSRQASYDGVIKKSYEQFLKDQDEGAMYREVMDYLSKTYKYSKTISNTILLYDPPVSMEYYTYSNAAGATYANIDEFKRAADQAVRMVAKDLDTRTRLIDISGHLYVVRNLVRSNYEPFATLVMEVNKDRLFESTDNVIWKKSGIVVLDGDVIRPDTGNTAALFQTWEKEQHQISPPREGEAAAYYDRDNLQALLCVKVNDQMLWFVSELDRTQLPSDRTAVLSVYIVVFITLIPLLIATFAYLNRNINQPVGALMKGSEKIRGGEYGYRIEPFDENEEMGQLVDTFNHMSASLEDSFNRIYVEEIAERDATLKALQSQINPHFLNNTLEIINWKARLSGNEDVSEMIGALSVMMNATLNRNNEMFIPLSEELSYVDAYLYIIRERFGSKFRFTKQIDESLLNVKIPRLIIQPIVENAVEHGGDEHGLIEGQLRVEGDDRILQITVVNNGTLTAEDREKIEKLLSCKKTLSGEKGLSGGETSSGGKDSFGGEALSTGETAYGGEAISGVGSLSGEKHLPVEKIDEGERLDRMSIGIRNVNLRLQLLYGNESGLSIEDDGAGRTVSTIRIIR